MIFAIPVRQGFESRQSPEFFFLCNCLSCFITEDFHCHSLFPVHINVFHHHLYFTYLQIHKLKVQLTTLDRPPVQG